MTARLRSGTRLLVAAVIGLVLAAGGVVAPASAAAPKIQVSTDGVTYTTVLTSGLFDDVGLLVPQDVETSSLWIRNPMPTPVSMRVSVKNLESSSAILSSSMVLDTTDSVRNETSESDLADLVKCQVIVPSLELGAGEKVRVDFTLTMKNVTDLVAQDETGSLDFSVAMRDAEAGPFPASACDDDGVTIPVVDPPVDPDPETPADGGNNAGGNLPFTGGDFPTGLLVMAGALVGLGFLLLKRRRREEEDEAVPLAESSRS